ncbi:hypothetical protein GCM10010191_56320 [Actinomadura vinacea]|uniref:Histidine kinase/HSP90-like ATPase domain-containing protein n=1 Tax=Actinomadura vinacea TaxID=115336 RepID=A0ABN3JN55_9ACTN
MDCKDGPQYALTLRTVPAAVPAGRQLVKAMLRFRALPELKDDATLVTAELVGNAIRYGQEIVLLLLLDDQRRVVVQVWDADPELPVLRDPEELDEGGRGLLLVKMCADEWGCTPCALGGKIVWAKIK